MTDLRTRLELACNKDIEGKYIDYRTKPNCVPSEQAAYRAGQAALFPVIEMMAVALEDYKHVAKPGAKMSQWSSAAEALCNLEMYLTTEVKINGPHLRKT